MAKVADIPEAHIESKERTDCSSLTDKSCSLGSGSCGIVHKIKLAGRFYAAKVSTNSCTKL
jgi:hypothetical protein